MEMTSSTPAYWLWALAFAAVAGAAILVPIWRHRRGRGQASPHGQRAARVLLLLVLGSPLLALGGYWLLAAEADSQALTAGEAEHDPERLVAALERKLKDDPQDIAGLLVLAKSYAALQRWTEARDAYTRATELAPDNPIAWSGKAEALAILAGHRTEGEPMALVRKALDLDPLDEKALELAGINAFQERNYAQAAYYWRQLAKRLPPDTPYAEDILAAAKQAKQLAEEAAFDPERKAEAPAAQPSAEGPRVAGVVDIAPGLRERAAADDPVYLTVRPTRGSAAPVAVLKAQAGQLPLAFEIDDSLAPSAQSRLSLHEEVSVSARIARSGDPSPMPGDLEGAQLDVKVGARDVRVVIDQIRP